MYILYIYLFWLTYNVKESEREYISENNIQGGSPKMAEE